MIKRDDIEKIIKAGSLAPSGSNSQPWKFFVKDGVITVYALYENDHPVLNYRNRGTLLAQGALLENIDTAAAALGYTAHVRLFPKGGENPVSEITFTEATPTKHALADAIAKRAINRKPYKKKPLSTDLREQFMEQGDGVDVKLVDDKKAIATMAEAASVSERVMFEDQGLHKLLIEEIVWTEEDERVKKSGLFLKTMELSAPQRAVLKMVKAWPATKLANKLGFSKMIARGNAAIYRSTALMGVILVTDTDKSFIEAGRVMERLWLRATAAGLGFHIMTGVGFFWQRMFLGDGGGFSPKHRTLVQESYDIMKKTVGSNDKKMPVVVFRIGYGGEPTARSSKKDPEIVFE